ncbi:hypothetical protein R5M92_13510 [Halomonas sp. Bachu 37]|uniref:hypothetical protein n=1 Tax=Halomonas kashgarensis TaxID=3084920 RepID=UPI003217FD78
MSQPITRVFISGVSEEAATAYLGHALFQALNAQWVAPEQSVALAQEYESAHWLWLYQPPWQLAETAQPDWAAWIAQHQPALRLQRVADKRLYVVNTARTPVAALAEALNVSATCPDQQEAPAYLGALAALCSGLGATVPAVRHAWELYETLEATAWLPSGMVPEFRSSLSVDEPALASLLQVVGAGVQAPARAQAHQATQAALEEAQVREQALQQAASQQEAALQALREEHKEATEENDLLLAQLHQVQEELEKQFLEGKAHQESAKTQLGEHTQRITALTQQLEQAKAKQSELSMELEKNRQAHKQAETAHTALKAEHQKLKLQQEQQQAQSSQALTQANTQQAELTQSLEASRKALADSEAEQTELAEENDLLLAQLHHVQEELERYFLANREYQTTLANAQPTFLRARQQISRLAAHLPPQA